jgi:hypothetical protein
MSVFQSKIYNNFRAENSWLGSSVGIATGYELDGQGIESRWGEFFRCPDWPWGPPSLLYNGHRVFPGGKMRLGRVIDHSPGQERVELYLYSPTRPSGPVTGEL